MKKVVFLAPIAAILGIIAAFLRGYELAFGFDFETELPKGDSWITPLLLVTGLAIAVVAFFALRKKRIPVMEAKDNLFYKTVSLFGCAVMLALAGYAIFTNSTGEGIIYIFAVLSILNAVAFAILGMKNLSANDKPVYSICAFLPVLWATLALILVFRARVSDPITQKYVFLLFAFISILLFTYTQTGYVYRKNRIRLSLITGAVGAYLCAIELIAPFVASAFNAEYVLKADFNILLPLLAYLVYMPAAIAKMLRNENNI